jgi:CubicO group peptidase (beta-lactamase class C family)
VRRERRTRSTARGSPDGAAVAILDGGEITYLGGFGITSVEDGVVAAKPRNR